jgi:type IV secretion system protein VirD4
MKPYLYRMPKDPGHLGRYSFGPAFMGFLGLILSNVAASQYIAHHFDYQDALGNPLARFGRIGFYQPLAWISWVWNYGRSADPAVRGPLLLAAFLVVVGAFLSGGVFFFINLRYTRQLSKDTEDLHGSARWANEGDVKKTGLLDSQQGVYVGGWQDQGARRLHYLRHNGPEHVLAFAPTRMGKGVALVIPTLLAWSDSAIIYDIKGENWQKTAGFRAHAGHLCFKFSPVEQTNTSHFNPLEEVRICSPWDVSDAQNMAQMIINTGEENPLDPHWDKTATSLTTGMILHVCYAAHREGRTPTLARLSALFTRPGTDFRATLQELLNYPHDPKRVFKWHMPTGESTATHPVVREKAQEMLNKEDREFSGVLSTAKTALSLYSDPLVVENTANSDFRIADLVDHEKPVSLYLVVPPAHKKRLRPLIRLIFTMIVNRLTEKLEFDGTEQQDHKHRLLVLIDEFPSLRKMDIFADALSYMGGFGLKAYLITQDIRQIVQEYGVNESIVSNCGIRVAFTPNQLETAELLSRMTGMETIQKAAFSYSGSRGSTILNHINESVQQIQRPLMTPDEVMRIPAPVKEGQSKQEKIIWPGDMLVFMAGHRPIYGKQMLYFFDDVLRARAEMPPPKSLPTTTCDGDPESTDESEAAPPDAPLAGVPGGPEHEDSHALRESGSMQIPKQQTRQTGRRL